MDCLLSLPVGKSTIVHVRINQGKVDILTYDGDGDATRVYLTSLQARELAIGILLAAKRLDDK